MEGREQVRGPGQGRQVPRQGGAAVRERGSLRGRVQGQPDGGPWRVRLEERSVSPPERLAPPKKKRSAGCTQASSPKRRTLLSRDATNLPADLTASLRPVLFRLRSSQRLSRRVAQERHAWVRREADSQGKRGDRAAGGGVAAGRVRWGRHGVLEVCLQEEGHGGRRCRAGGQKIEATGRGRRKVWREEVFRTLLSPLEYIFFPLLS
mmetsp:Transcript_6073/g.20900  ORF Transcript_6073/g.20900 Transcript_6073/m.20900 type:complete len:207 (-) Transcript_6073:6-626(-)